MKEFPKKLHSRSLILVIGLTAVAGLLGGCVQSQAAREIRSDYTADTYLQAIETAAATRSLARELLEHDSPETIRKRLEGELVVALEAARTDDTGLPLEDPAAMQKRTIRAVLWYEGERAGLERWYAGEIDKIDQLAGRIESTGEAAVRANDMADRELTVSREALQSFLRTGLPQVAGQAIDEYLRTRNAAEVADSSPEPNPTPTPSPTTE